MKKWLVFVIVLSVFLLQVTSAVADELTYEKFDDWKNPYVAEGWRTHSVGGWGGEFNQIYEAGQGISCGGDRNDYRSVYKDLKATPQRTYLLTFEYTSNAIILGRLDRTRVWLQCDDKTGKVLETHGGCDGGTHWRPWSITATAPLGTDHIRVVLQTMGSDGGGSAFKNIILYEDNIPIAGPFLVRNTEWHDRNVAKGWRTHSVGGWGDYTIHPVGSSSQGVSCGGTFADYKSVYKDLKVTPGQKYKLSVDAISNSTNENGTRIPSPVRIWVQYSGRIVEWIKGVKFDHERVLSTHGIDGTQAGIKDNEWTTVTVPGPRGEPYTVAPENADRARIILQVMGGTGGGTIFDNVSLTRYEQ